ncbi:MAG: hypothetical protein GY809_08830, partial [Planctomycetes bacterium]|nr:hypothetical protein [Planctomycetota bacterium]
SLPVDLQVKLIDALGGRGDPVARPAILKMLNSETEAIRDVAASALAGVASPSDIPVLARMAATGSDLEKKAARRSLRLLPGHDMNTAMGAALQDAEAQMKIELMSALVDRKVIESIPVILKSVHDADLTVRLAVLDALRAMAGAKQTAIIVTRLKSAQDKKERRQAALTLVATCRRGRTKCAPAVIAGFKDADAPTRIALMRALLEAGGPKSLNEIVGRLKDKDKTVSSEAVRILSNWPDRTAYTPLTTLAGDVKNLRNHILALRGIVRLAGPAKDRAGDFATLSKAMTLATRKEEKVLVLGALGTIPTWESLTLVASFLDQPSLAEDAGLAAVVIAEKIGKDKQDQARAVMQKVAKTVKREKTRDRAKKVLEAPQSKASPSKS